MSRRQFSLKRLLGLTGVASLLLGLIVHNTPLRLRFALSERAINDVVKEVESGRCPAVPCRAGLFFISEIVPGAGGKITLWTGGDSGGRWGLVSGISGHDPRYFWQARLNDVWWYVVEE